MENMTSGTKVMLHNIEDKCKFPDVYIVSKFSSLYTDLEEYLPKSVNIVPVYVSDLQLNNHEIIQIPETTVKILQNAEILITESNCLANLLYILPNIKWVQNTLAGVETVIDNIDVSKPLPEFTLTRYSDSYFGDLLSNYVLAQIINVERKFFHYHDMQKLRHWDRPQVLPNYRTLRDLTIGILGSGTVGSAVGNLLKKAGCRVIAYVLNERKRSSENFDMAVTNLNVVLKESDYICNSLPSTKDTRGLLDSDVLQNCKKKPVFINIGRADIIRNSSIVRALSKGWISGAILDVSEEEPLPSDSELWSIPEVHLTPHVGAMPKSEGIAKFFAENYLKYVKGEPLMNVVNWEKGY